jgi:hypothetical protein
MVCPGCAQRFEQAGEEGKCPYCGYPCAEYQRQVTSMQVVLGAIFASTLVYAGLVAFLELVARREPPMAPDLAWVAGLALIVVSAGAVVASLVMEPAVLAGGDLASVRKAAALLAVAAETPTVSGVLFYLLTGSIQWFVVSLGVSWVLFIRLGVRLPSYLQRISEHLRVGE